MTSGKSRCLICYGVVPGDSSRQAHGRCLRDLFGTGRMPKLDVDPSKLHLLGLQMAGQTTLSGVQRKIALGLEHGVLKVSVPPTRYILKPGEERFPHLPENEHLCLLLARQAGFEVPPHGLIRLVDESLALIVRRFDRTDEGRRLPLEDFCQLGEKLPREKYDGSAELCAKLVRRFSAAPLIDLRELFRVLLFSWWIGNGDLHLKNLSLLTRERGEPRLSPVYDLVNTALVIPADQLALPIAGKRSNLRSADWMDLADRCDLPPEVVADLAGQMAGQTKTCIERIRRSFLPEDSRVRFAAQLVERESELIELARTADRASSKRPKTSGPEFLTGAKAGKIRHELEQRLAALGVTLRDTVLGADLAEVEWLARYPGGVFEPGAPFARDPDRGRRAFIKAVRYDRILRSLRRSGGVPGLERVARHLKRLSVEESGPDDSEAWDHLFQLELGALLRARWWQLEFERNDTDLVIVDSQGERFGIECKRPRKAGTVGRNVADAIEQLRARGVAGLVAISLDLLHPGYVIMKKGVDESAALSHVVDRVLAPLTDDVQRLFPGDPPAEDSLGGAVFGALFCTSVVTFRELEGGSYLAAPRFWTRAIVNPLLPGFAELLGFFENVLRAGQRELW